MIKINTIGKLPLKEKLQYLNPLIVLREFLKFKTTKPNPPIKQIEMAKKINITNRSRNDENKN